MAIIPITIDNLENFTLTANPFRTFSSSSQGGATGSIKIFSRASTIEKEAFPLEDYGADSFGIANVEDLRINVIRATDPSNTKSRSVFFSTSSVTSSFYTGSETGQSGYLTQLNPEYADNLDWSYFSTASLMRVGKDLTGGGSMYLVFRGPGEAGQIEIADTNFTNTAVEGNSPPSRHLVTSQSYGGDYDDKRHIAKVEIRYAYQYSGTIRPGGQQGSVDLMTNNPTEATVFAIAAITAAETNKANLHGDTLIIPDANSNTVTFTYDQTAATPAKVSSTAYTIGASGVTTTATHAAAIQAAIALAKTNINLRITSTVSSAVVSLTQDTGSTSGNTTISGTAVSGAEVTVVQFSGGAGDDLTSESTGVWQGLYFERSTTGLPGSWELIHSHSVTRTTAATLTPVTASVTGTDGAPGPWYFRWIQKKYSGTNYDHWAIANVGINVMKRYVSGGMNISPGMDEYVSLVNSSSASPVRQKRVEVVRFEPSFKDTKDTGRKRVVRNILFPYYRDVYPSCHWAYPNYHTLNFFTSSDVPSTSVLIYPCQTGSAETNSTDDFPYSAPNAFTFDFWINPRYTTDQPHTDFRAGTIMHLSSSYAVSLVSGSSKDINGYVDHYRIMLQLSESADIQPSSCSLAPANNSPARSQPVTYGIDQSHVYLSSDNALKRNNWHHVAIRWGGPNVNNGGGSFVIDGNLDAAFNIKSSSIMPSRFEPPMGDPDALFIGNYFHGNQDSDRLGTASSGFITITDAIQINGTIKIIGNDEDKTERTYIADYAADFDNKNDDNEYSPKFYYGGTAGTAASRAIAAAASLTAAINQEFGHLNKVTAVQSENTGLITLTQANQAFPGDNGNTEITVAGANVTSTNFAGGGVGAAALTAQFFNVNAAYENGVVNFFGAGSGGPDGASQESTHLDPNEIKFKFGHPLNAEVHELRIWDSYKDIDSIVTGSKHGLTTLPSDLLFYVPPYFVKETKERAVLQTPFQSTRAVTNDPFNVAMSFGIGGRELNLPNFTREFVNGVYPRLWHLTSSEIPTQQQTALLANTFLYTRPSLRKRNLTVLPNDNGKFAPGFELLASGTVALNPISGSEVDRFVNDFGTLNYGFISLNDMVSTASLPEGLIDITSDTRGTILNDLEGANPEDPGIAPGNILTILNRTRDNSSNEVEFFDASNLFYGNRIRPETYVIEDPNLTGSAGKVSMKLRDNGQGGLYRANCEGPHAKWNAVGSVLYEEGIAVIKSPNIPFFGKDDWRLQFEGEYNIHVLEVNIPCPKGTVNSSSNPNWKPYAPTSYDTENADQFTYITGINLHDENFNIIARANLAQPTVKRDTDGYLFRMRIDF